MTDSPKDRRGDLPYFTEIARQVAVLRAEGRDVIHLDVGSPDLPPAGFIVGALQ